MSQIKRVLERVQLEDEAKDRFSQTLEAFENEIGEYGLDEIEEFFASAYAMIEWLRQRVEEENHHAVEEYQK